jgi:hypothetical protein
MQTEGHVEDVAKAVGIAVLSALATSLMTWGLAALKARYVVTRVEAPAPKETTDAR